VSVERVGATKAGVVVNGVVYDKAGKRGAPVPDAPFPSSTQGDEQLTVPLSSDEEPLGLGFDEASGEGAIVIRASERILLRRFDRQGRFLGEAAAFAHPLPAAWIRLARAGGTWAPAQSGAPLEPGPTLPEGCVDEVQTRPGVWVSACSYAPDLHRPGRKASVRVRTGPPDPR
jgi:hypothetical protein